MTFNGILAVLLAVSHAQEEKSLAQSPSRKEETSPGCQTHRHIWMKCTGQDSPLRPAPMLSNPSLPLWPQ